MPPGQFLACRLRLGLSINDLADVLSSEDRRVDARTVRRWENNTRSVPPAVAAWLSQAARVPEPAADWFRAAAPSNPYGD